MLTLVTLVPWSWLRSRSRPGRPLSRPNPRPLRLEVLEARTLLSTAPIALPLAAAVPGHTTPTNNGLTPAQVRHFYGFDQARATPGGPLLDGTGQTIAIVNPYNDPTIAADVKTFSQAF